MPDKKTKKVETKAKKKATMCDVIRYLNGLEEPLVADCDYAPRSLECIVDCDKITGFNVRMPCDDVKSSAQYDAFSIKVLGVKFSTDCYMNYEDDGAECWEIPDNLEIGDISAIQDILEEKGCEKQDDGTYSVENIQNVLKDMLADKTSCDAGEYEFTVEDVLTAIYDVSSDFYRNSEDDGVYISTDYREEGVRYHRISANTAAKDLLSYADFEYVW